LPAVLLPVPAPAAIAELDVAALVLPVVVPMLLDVPLLP